MVRRMWINQPSKLQTHHSLHGRNVLGVEEGGSWKIPMYRIYFLNGKVISQRIPASALCEGWV